jgi:SAM-dependent methyltransferase
VRRVSDAQTPDVDALTKELRARVEERRQEGTYSAELEDDLAAEFEYVLSRRGRRPPDLSAPLAAVGAALAFNPARIPVESERPAGEVVHKAVARVVGRQVQGVFEQVGAFGQEVHRALAEIASAFEALSSDLSGRVDALYERQAAQERALVQGRPPGGSVPSRRWFSAAALEEELHGPFAEARERRRELAARLADAGSVLDLACGRGELLDVLGEMGVEALGVDREVELVEGAVARGLQAEVSEPVWYLAQLEDASLGAVALVRGLDRLEGNEVIDLVAVSARKVRPGGVVLVEAADPEAPVAAGATWRDPGHVRLVHPACLTFLFREAGFSDVAVEWSDRRDEPAGGPGEADRLERLVRASAGYRLVATR